MEYQLKVNFSAGNNYVDVTSGDASQAASGMPLYINDAPFYVQSLSGSRIHLTAPLAYSQTGADALLQTEHINGRALLAGGEVSPQIAVNAINAGLAALEQVALRDADLASAAEMAAGAPGKVPDAAVVKGWFNKYARNDVNSANGVNSVELEVPWNVSDGSAIALDIILTANSYNRITKFTLAWYNYNGNISTPVLTGDTAALKEARVAVGPAGKPRIYLEFAGGYYYTHLRVEPLMLSGLFSKTAAEAIREQEVSIIAWDEPIPSYAVGTSPIARNYGLVNKWEMVGVVSDSVLGRPDGAIIETGTNANGTYTKFADGTLICTARRNDNFEITAGGGSTFYYANVKWTFPHPMSDWTFHADMQARASGRLTPTCTGDHTFTQGSFFVTSLAASSDTLYDLHFSAIGRWK